MPVLGYFPRFVKPRTSHVPRQDAIDHFYPEERLPYLPGRATRDIENARLALFVHPQEEYAVDANFERAMEIVYARYQYAEQSKVYPFELVCDIVCTSDTGDASPGPEYKALGYNTKREVLLGCVRLVGSREVALPPLKYTLVKSRYDLIMSGVFTWGLWGASLKDELVKRAKWEDGDTRLFAGGPLEDLLAAMSIWGPVFDVIYDHWKAQWCVAGVSPKHGQWPHMLSRFDAMIMLLNCDFKWFDTSQRAPYFRCGSEILRRLCKDHPAAFILIEQCLNAPLVTSWGDILKKRDGMPSGAFITLILNCFIDEILIVAAHLDACGPADDHLTASIMGDDNGIGIMQLCGMTKETLKTSHASRGFLLKDCVEHETLDDVRFCGLIYNKTGYHPREDKLLCALCQPRIPKTWVPMDYILTIGQIRDELVFSPRVDEVERWYQIMCQHYGIVRPLAPRERAMQIWTGTEQRFFKKVLECSGVRQSLSYMKELCT